MKLDRRRLPVALAMLLLAGTVSSCAYYNTFYLARKYYMKATDGAPYEVDREGSQQRANYNKSADYSKKVLGVHPKSKWVDDAWLLWAKTLVGTDDPLKAVAMLQEFETRFPQSELRPDAEFFLGLAYRSARKYELAVDRFDNFLAQAPKNELVPYAWYERSRAMLALSRSEEAAKSAGEVIDRFPKSVLVDRALRTRAEARFLERDWVGARADFKSIGARALTDDDRFRYLLREVDCLESNREYDEARAVLRDARSHVPAPIPPPEPPRVGAPGTPATPPPPVVTTVVPPGQDRYGRLTLRMGGVELLAGRVKESVDYYQAVLHDYPRTQLAAEAQYRIGYAYETGGDDFARARVEYQKVKEQTGQSQFSQQAEQRLANLDRIERFRNASGADSLERQAESRFLKAEHYLFNLERPERALAEYRAISDSSSSQAVIARALNAQAWVLARKLDQPKAADSLFWKVVREYPATEAQLAARDYLEAEGQTVPASLIVPPKEPSRPLLDVDSLKRPPRMTPPLGGVRTLPADPLRLGNATRAALIADSLRRVRALSELEAAQHDTSAAGRMRADSLRRVFMRPDTTGRAALMAEIERNLSKPEGVVLAPEGTPPNLTGDPEAPKVDLRNAAPITPSPLPETRGVEDVARLSAALPDSAGFDSTRYDSTRAVRARSATMDWLTGRNLEVRPLSRPGPLPSRRPAANRARPDTSAARAQRPDSLGGSTPVATDPGFLPIEAEGSPPPEVTEPAKPASRGITSFQRLTKAERAALRETQRREKAVRDSVKQVKKAQRQAADAAEKAAKEAKKHPKAPALPDTVATAKAQRDSLARIAAPPPIGTSPANPARPDSSARDTSGSRH